MTERPILFQGPMVRALLAGTKTQTRRVVKPQPEVDGLPVEIWWKGGRSWDGSQFQNVTPPWGEVVKHRVQFPRLWVRETFSGPWCMEKTHGCAAAPPSKWGKSSQIWYWADGEPTYGDWTRPRPSIHMPRWASRIMLEVNGVRVERLQDISEADAIAEGIPSSEVSPPDMARFAYRQLWESINGPGSWDANPWVWVIEFRRGTT